MNRRSFIGLILGATAAISLRAARDINPDVAEVQRWQSPAYKLGDQLSYLTRRSYLGEAYSQIYDTSPLLCGLLKESNKDTLDA